MKKIFLFLGFAFILSFNSQAQFTFGAGGSYLSDNGFDAFGLQGKAYYDYNETFDLSPTFTFWLEDGLDWSIDADVHYKLLNIGESFDFNPFAGLSLVSGFETDLRINLGGSFRFDLESGSSLYIEPKFVIISGSSFIISGGYLF